MYPIWKVVLISCFLFLTLAACVDSVNVKSYNKITNSSMTKGDVIDLLGKPTREDKSKKDRDILIWETDDAKITVFFSKNSGGSHVGVSFRNKKGFKPPSKIYIMGALLFHKTKNFIFGAVNRENFEQISNRHMNKDDIVELLGKPDCEFEYVESNWKDSQLIWVKDNAQFYIDIGDKKYAGYGIGTRSYSFRKMAKMNIEKSITQQTYDFIFGTLNEENVNKSTFDKISKDKLKSEQVIDLLGTPICEGSRMAEGITMIWATDDTQITIAFSDDGSYKHAVFRDRTEIDTETSIMYAEKSMIQTAKEFIFGTTQTVTSENYAKIKVGMTEIQIHDILGKPTGKNPLGKRGGYPIFIWESDTDKQSFRNDIVVEFLDRKVVQIGFYKVQVVDSSPLNELADKLELCEGYSQKGEVMGNLQQQRTVYGLFGDKCLYIEYFPKHIAKAGFGLQCKYSEDFRKAVAEYYRKFSNVKSYKSKIDLSGNENQKIILDGKEVEIKNSLLEALGAGICRTNMP